MYFHAKYMCVCSFSVCYYPALTCPWAPWQLDTLPMDEEAAASPIVTPSPLPPKNLDETPDKARLQHDFQCHMCDALHACEALFNNPVPEVEQPPDGVTPSLQHEMRTKQKKGMTRGRKAKKDKKGGKRAKKTGTPKKDGKTAAAAKKAKADSGESIKRSNSGKHKIATLRRMKELSPKKSHPDLDTSPDTESQHKRKAMKKHPAVGNDEVCGKRRKRPASPAPAAPKGKGKTSKVKYETWVEKASGSEGPSTWVQVATKEVTKVHQDRVNKGKTWRYAVLDGQVYGCSNCRFIYNGCSLCRKKTFRGKSAKQVWDEEDGPMVPSAGSEAGGKVAKKAKKSKKGGKKTKGPGKKSSA